MCIELKRLQKTVGISFVHVTHNQEEAMSVADRIAIIADGEIVDWRSYYYYKDCYYHYYVNEN